MKTFNLIDNVVIKFATIDTAFLQIVRNSKASALNPGNGLIRYQFLEIIMRLAFKRYEESKEVATKLEAVQQFVQLNLKDSYQNVDTQVWRKTRYWNEEVDNLYKSHLPIWEHLFNSFGGRNKKPGERHYIMVDEFDTMWQYSGLVNDDFGARDAFTFFNAAMMTQIDELESDKHVKASFVEFLEMIGRCAEKIAFPPIEP